jgi:hypothetical protein
LTHKPYSILYNWQRLVKGRHAPPLLELFFHCASASLGRAVLQGDCRQVAQGSPQRLAAPLKPGPASSHKARRRPMPAENADINVRQNAQLIVYPGYFFCVTVVVDI